MVFDHSYICIAAIKHQRRVLLKEMKPLQATLNKPHRKHIIFLFKNRGVPQLEGAVSVQWTKCRELVTLNFFFRVIVSSIKSVGISAVVGEAFKVNLLRSVGKEGNKGIHANSPGLSN